MTQFITSPPKPSSGSEVTGTPPATPAPRVDTGRIYGGTFHPHDRNNPRTIIAGWVSDGANVLEIGPGNGVIGRWLREQKHCHVVGVEYVPEAAAIASAFFDQMLIGSIEDEAIVQQAARLGPFDAIIFADVLEHLVDPWAVLRRMRALLKPEGRVLLSMPNIAHWSARLNLLLGRFDYTEGYLMDRTHLRWFTRRTAKAMGRASGYRVAAEAAVHRPHFFRLWPTLSGYQTVLNLALDASLT